MDCNPILGQQQKDCVWKSAWPDMFMTSERNCVPEKYMEFLSCSPFKCFKKIGVCNVKSSVSTSWVIANRGWSCCSWDLTAGHRFLSDSGESCWALQSWHPSFSFFFSTHGCLGFSFFSGENSRIWSWLIFLAVTVQLPWKQQVRLAAVLNWIVCRSRTAISKLSFLLEVTAWLKLTVQVFLKDRNLS